MFVNPMLKLSLYADVAPHLLESVLSECSGLECLKLGYFCSLSDMRPLCNTVTIHCKQLRSLGFGLGCLLSDEDVIVLLIGLPGLKELNLRKGDRITSRTLRAIVDNRCFLDKFCCGNQGFQGTDVAKFRQLAREAGILPVPWVGPYISSWLN